ncbi:MULTISPECIES: PspC domain-containing protein [unclassified Nocardioides]|uniref:PspC domain-containing protein n=1 Tax=unclassified Nocardioides TaxID=2615069 RepID=UPI00188602A0|nr:MULTISPECIES: PspC domain-containing protein [unclassified Nocardioides]
MTSTPPDAPIGPDGPDDPGAPGGPGRPAGGPRARGEEIRDLGRLRRSTTDHHVAGVAGGLARHLDIDPVILRVAFVVLIFFGGAGLLLYGACWLLVPPDDGTAPVVRLDDRTRSIVLLVAAGLSALALVGDSWGVIGFPWPLAIVGAVALVLLTRNRDSAPASPPAYEQYPYAAQAPGAGPATGPTTGPATDPAAVPGAPTYQPGTYQPWMAANAVPPTGTYPPPYTAPPSNPTRRGPLLFWVTMALAALGVGILGIVDVAGAGVPDSAYAALVVATCGVMLVLGAFFGRAGGLTAVGLVAALLMAGTTVGENLVDGDERYRPLSSLEVESSYDVGAGDLVLDLSAVEDPEALAGRSIDVEGGVGRLEVIVPDDLRVRASADVGIGSAALFASDDAGFGVSTGATSGPAGEPLEIVADLGIGQVRIHTESQEAAR